MKHLLNIEDFSVQETIELIELSNDIIDNPDKYREKCKHKKLATLFYEPSTRTRLSFESAMLDLGGNVIGFSSANNSSAAKGETVGDTVKIVGGYSDIIAIRHPLEGAPTAATLVSDVPIINAGDGGHQHPTQTLTDLLTISRELGRLDNLTIGLCGDLKFGRTVHSLIVALSKHKNNKFVLISPKELQLPSYIKEDILDTGTISFCTTDNLDEYMSTLDVLYMTRVQRERFEEQEDYEKFKDCYILTPDKLKNAKQDMRVLHPLPRLNEISTEIDSDFRACYFRQAQYGKFIRMALILKLLNENDGKIATITNNFTSNNCSNSACITNYEAGLKKYYTESKNGQKHCKYCQHILNN